MNVREMIMELMKFPMDSDLQVAVGKCIVTTNELELKSAEEITDIGDEYKWFDIRHEGCEIGTGINTSKTKITFFNYEREDVVELFVENIVV